MSLALLPTFDLSFLASDTQPSAELLQRVDKACRGNGFFQILNHGVPASLQQDMMVVTRKLYSLPLESKMRLSLSSSHKRRGYSGLGQQRLDPAGAPDFKESFYISEDTLTSGNQYPNEADVPNFKSLSSAYYREMISLSQSIFRLLALALKLPESTFDSYSGANGDETSTWGSTLRLVHYPPIDENADARQLGCGAHTDFGTLTLLLQDGTTGLEIQDMASGSWVSVPAQKNTYVVNIGDLMQRWTNDQFRSAPHRVRCSASVSRYSIPFFFNGNYEFTIAPLTSTGCSEPSVPAKYKPITVGEHIKQRIESSHIDLGRR